MYYKLITKDTPFDAVILANGEYPESEFATSLLRQAPYIICCDGAAMHFAGKPTAIVGDGDSLPADFKSQYQDIIVYVSEQEDNDLTKATRFCIDHFRGDQMLQGRKLRILYLGATGKREDHTMANISLMIRYARDFNIEPVMITDYGYFIPCIKDKNYFDNKNSFETFPRQQISIFNFGCTQLEGTGFRWNPYAYEELWQGSLNEATGNKVTLVGDNNYLLYLTFEKKV